MKADKTTMLLAAALFLTATGCQTFSLTEEQFERQQHGQPADPQTGAVVGVAGSVAYLGAMIGAAVAGVK